jgi:hypothetical protein
MDAIEALVQHAVLSDDSERCNAVLALANLAVDDPSPGAPVMRSEVLKVLFEMASDAGHEFRGAQYCLHLLYVFFFLLVVVDCVFIFIFYFFVSFPPGQQPSSKKDLFFFLFLFFFSYPSQQ